MELTGGRPQLTMGTLQADGPPPTFHDEGLALHRAGDESQPLTGPILRTEADGTMFCNDMVFFPYLDDVYEGDGGLVCLPGSRALPSTAAAAAGPAAATAAAAAAAAAATYYGRNVCTYVWTLWCVRTVM